MFHGHNEKSAEKEIDQENLYRIIDDYVYTNFSKETELPLVLFALPENQAVFRKISNNRFLSDVKVPKSSAQLSNREIEEEVEHVTKALAEKRFNQLIEDFEETIPSLKLDEQLDDLALASIEGRIDYLLIRDDYVVKGEIDENGMYHENPKNDYVNDLAWNVVRTNGRIYVLNQEEMPSSESIMAGLRY